VHRAAGGVGTSTLRLAPAFGAGRVIAVVSSEAKADVARAAGASDVVLADGFKDAVKELTDGRGVDIVVDPVGGDRFTDSLRSLAPGGRLLVVGFTGGEIPTVKVNRLLLNNVDAVGVGWGPGRAPTRVTCLSSGRNSSHCWPPARSPRPSPSSIRWSARAMPSRRSRTAPPQARSSSRCAESRTALPQCL
jgi:NADPH:quinone reductase-like Zn-dependent oxidoreductase